MKIALPKIDTDLLRAEICRRDFFEFFLEFWDEIITEPFVYNWHVEYLCRELQKIGERVEAGLPKEYDLICNVPPGSSKSSIITIMFPAWIWTRMEHCRIISGSYAKDVSLDQSNKSRQIILSDKYQKWYGIEMSKSQDSKGYYKNVAHGDRFTTSTGSNVTGMHGHLLIADDPLNPKQAASEKDTETANTWISETLLTRKVNKEVTTFIMVMQRLSFNDPTAYLMEKNPKNYKHICLPAEDSDLVKPAGLRRYYKEGVLDPNRLNLKILDAIKADLGPYGYSCQFDQHPVPRGEGMFNCDRLVVEETYDPSQIKEIVRYWDCAGTSRNADPRACYTSGTLMATLNDGSYWVLSIVKGQWSIEERNRVMRETAQADGDYVQIWQEQEPGSGGKEAIYFSQKNLEGFKLNADRVTGSKDLRAGPLSAAVDTGKIHVLNRPWTQNFILELSQFPVGRLKDTVDSTAGAFSKLHKTKKMRIW